MAPKKPAPNKKPSVKDIAPAKGGSVKGGLSFKYSK